MANEITVSMSMQIASGNLKHSHSENIQVDMATLCGGNPGTVTIGTTEEAIDFGDITSEGWVYIKNLDSTNYVQWGPEESSAMVEVGKLLAGEFAILRLDPGLTLRMKANTAACNVYIACYEET